MPEYRFFFWTEPSERIDTVEVAEFLDDAGAIGWVDRTFSEHTPYRLAEIWSGDRLVQRRNRA